MSILAILPPEDIAVADNFVQKLTTLSQWKFKALIPELESAIENCRAKASSPQMGYRAAVRLCSKNRDLIMFYFNEWQSVEGLSVYAKELSALFDSAVEALKAVQPHLIGADAKHESHLEKMIANTELRVKICDIIAEEGNQDDKYQAAMNLYKKTQTSRNFDLSAA